MNERLGEINKNKFGTEMKIIAYRKSDDIDIQFLDEYGYVFEHQIYSNFKWIFRFVTKECRIIFGK